MGKSASEVRSEIEETRREMSETIDAIADRASPRRAAHRSRRRISHRLQSARERVMGSAQDAYGSAGERVQGMAGSAQGTAGSMADQARQAPEAMARQTQGNPIAAGVIAFGGGLLLSSLLPPSEPEKRMAGSLMERSQPLQGELKQAGQQIAEDLKSSAQEGVEQVKQRSTEAVGNVTDEARSSAQSLQSEARQAGPGSSGG